MRRRRGGQRGHAPLVAFFTSKVVKLGRFAVRVKIALLVKGAPFVACFTSIGKRDSSCRFARCSARKLSSKTCGGETDGVGELRHVR
jgi:hypothetical protein